jgi:hypothetical protein
VVIILNNRFIVFRAISLKFSGKGLKVLAQADSAVETQGEAQPVRDCEQSIHWDLHQLGGSQASEDYGEERRG